MRTSQIKQFNDDQAHAITDAVQWVRDQTLKNPATGRRARDDSYTIGTVTSDMAPDATGTIDVEKSNGTIANVTAYCINPHDVTLEQGLRVRLEDWAGWDELVAVPVDYSACDEPNSPQTIPIS